MVSIGTVFSPIGKKALLCGSGELGKEVAIELQRYGIEVVALERYPNAPAMQVAHRSYVVLMLDGAKLREIIEREHPDYIIPEIEAIATDVLVDLEKEGYHVVPTARAAQLTMNREGIRRLAAWVTHISVLFRCNTGGVRTGGSKDRISVCDEADHEFVGTWTERFAFTGGCRSGMAPDARGRPGRSRQGDCRGVCEVRL